MTTQTSCQRFMKQSLDKSGIARKLRLYEQALLHFKIHSTISGAKLTVRTRKPLGLYKIPNQIYLQEAITRQSAILEPGRICGVTERILIQCNNFETPGKYWNN